MAKPKIAYVCQSCGAVHSRWQGHCDSCGAWNSIVEEIQSAAPPNTLAASSRKAAAANIEFVDLKGQSAPLPRLTSQIGEWDRVTGGGLVPGSVTLIGGDPGIGKSTLLLQVVASLSRRGVSCAYISGEEAIDQVRLRARRMELETAPVHLAATTSVRDIVAACEPARDGSKPFELVVIDSIQTMFVDTVESTPGTVGQVRAATQELIRLAKKNGITILIVGHVTKEGTIAGPRVLEHMVDTVLYFEGDRGHQFRILRGVKNRFGPTDEIGVFAMASQGLEEVPNPSAIFLSQRSTNVPGSAVFAGLEGTRPVLVEIQALVAPTAYSAPKRAAVGWDGNRLSMLLAVLEARCGVMFSGQDVYLNVAGGLRVSETGADLAVAAALVSALSGDPVASDTVLFGEIGLAGEIRPVPQPELRLKEAQKLGFDASFLPVSPGKKKIDASGMTLKPLEHLNDLTVLFKRPPSREF